MLWPYKLSILTYDTATMVRTESFTSSLKMISLEVAPTTATGVTYLQLLTHCGGWHLTTLSEQWASFSCLPIAFLFALVYF